MAKRTHWTQTPEGKERMRQILNARWQKVNKDKKRRKTRRVTRQPEKIQRFSPDRSLLVQLAELKKAASSRIEEIDDRIIELEKEREEILANFPEFRQSRKLREVKEA